MKPVKPEYLEKSGREIAIICASTAIDGKAEDLAVYDVTGLCAYADFLIIMSGRSTRHVQGLAENIEGALRAKRLSAATEGLAEGQWVILDFSDVVVHIFYHEQRTFYNLDGLWRKAPRLTASDAGVAPSRSSIPLHIEHK
ncbi:MAG: ribosome silencing factor [Desulfobulbaceae bacterium]|jgi:ribosome-associated protein|nr:ribosome silencing factor [Desulfobulbaceae bacterium]